MALVLADPGAKAIAKAIGNRPIYCDLNRDSVADSLFSSSDEDRAEMIFELSLRGEAEIPEYLDAIVEMLNYTPTSAVKQGVCQAVRAAGAAGLPYSQDIAMVLSDRDPDVQYE